MSGGDPPPDGSHGPHVLVADVDAPVLDDDDRHHLERSLRVRPGDPLTVCDGAGRWRACRLGAEPDPVGEVQVVDPPQPAIGVGFALIKGGRPELVVQKLTELGVDRIMLFAAARSVVRWDDAKAAHNQARLRRVAREALMQSRRAWLPDVVTAVRLEELLAEAGVAMADRTGAPLDTGSAADPGITTILVGPEGGWTPEEVERAPALVRVGGPVLRAETACIAGGVLLSAKRESLR